MTLRDQTGGQASLERRAVLEQIELREDGEAPTITGLAAVFDSPTDIGGMFTEVIRPGAFDRAIAEEHDVRALINHDPNLLLGRTKSGTLKLEVTKRGLKVSITPPDTQSARDVVQSIKRGDMDGMSFAFYTLQDRWTDKKGKPPLRELLDLELLDVSPVTYPAYKSTSVSARAEETARRLSDSQDDEPEPAADPAPCGPGVDLLRRRLDLDEADRA